MATYHTGQLVDVVLNGIGVRRGRFLSHGVNGYVNVLVDCEPPFGYDPPLCEFSDTHETGQTHHVYRVKADHMYSAERVPLIKRLTNDDLFGTDV